MSVEENEAIVRRICEEFWNERKLEAAEARERPLRRTKPLPAKQDIEIRPATEADEATIRSMVRAARLVPTNLHWSRFLVAEEGGRIVGMRQVKVHKGGTREVASGMVLPEYRRRGISAGLMHALLDHEHGPLYLRCKEKWARYYERFGFRRVEPSELPADFRKDYRIGTIIVAILFLFSRSRPRFIPMKRDGYRAWPTHDDVGTLRQLRGHAPPLVPKTGTTLSGKDGDRIALDR